MRTTVEFEGEAAQTISKLATSTKRSQATVLRNALSLYAFAVKELQQDPTLELAFVKNGQIMKVAVGCVESYIR